MQTPPRFPLGRPHIADYRLVRDREGNVRITLDGQRVDLDDASSPLSRALAHLADVWGRS